MFTTKLTIKKMVENSIVLEKFLQNKSNILPSREYIDYLKNNGAPIVEIIKSKRGPEWAARIQQR